jgi:preprotein translocase subunit SecE
MTLAARIRTSAATVSPKRARVVSSVDWARCRPVPLRQHIGGYMAEFSPFKFMQEVRQEVAKVTWPSRREVFVTTIMVFVMVFLAGIFFLLVDQTIRWIVAHVLGIGA